jgi:hypothetical protein
MFSPFFQSVGSCDEAQVVYSGILIDSASSIHAVSAAVLLSVCGTALSLCATVQSSVENPFPWLVLSCLYNSGAGVSSTSKAATNAQTTRDEWNVMLPVTLVPGYQ